jgi:hypothetical protein
LRTDDGFEDREGHQAPFTLPKADSGNRKPERLFELFDPADDLVEVGPVAGIEFGMEHFAIGANFKCAAARWDERERFDVFAEFKDLGRQTDGLGRVVSDDAIFDRDLRFHSACSFPVKKVRKPGKAVKESESAAKSGRVVRRRAVAETFHDRPSNPFPSARLALRGSITNL